MKALFTEVRRGDLPAVKSRLDADPGLVDAIAKAPPKKDDGQSVLQVAIKSGNLAIADFLLDRGADVNYIDRSPLNSWNTPVLHDAVRATVFSARFGRNRALPGAPPNIEMMSTLDRFKAAFGVLRRMISLGSDVGALDSFANPALARALLDARQVISEPMSADLAEDLARIFDLLLAAGADVHYVDPKRGESLLVTFGGEAVGRFLLR